VYTAAKTVIEVKKGMGKELVQAPGIPVTQEEAWRFDSLRVTGITLPKQNLEQLTVSS